MEAKSGHGQRIQFEDERRRCTDTLKNAFRKHVEQNGTEFSYTPRWTATTGDDAGQLSTGRPELPVYLHNIWQAARCHGDLLAHRAPDTG